MEMKIPNNAMTVYQACVVVIIVDESQLTRVMIYSTFLFSWWAKEDPFDESWIIESLLLMNGIIDGVDLT